MDLSGKRQSQLSAATGVAAHHIGDIMKGKIQPKLITLVELIEATGCEIIELRVKKPEAT